MDVGADLDKAAARATGTDTGVDNVDGRTNKRARDRDKGSQYEQHHKDAKRGCKQRTHVPNTGAAAGAGTGAAGICEYTILETNEEVVRYVTPYVHTFSTHAKGRWLGRQLLEVLLREFGSHSEAYWTSAIAQGFVRINHLQVTGTELFRNGDFFTHMTHRHEPPVIGSVELVGVQLQHAQTLPAAVSTAPTSPSPAAHVASACPAVDLLAVNKPASFPMHPCGSYKFNSLLNVLEQEPLLPSPQQPPLHLVHRLDRVTSGLVVLAGSKQAAHRVSQQILLGHTTKYYIARVKGRFSDAHAMSAMPPLLGTELQVVRSAGEAGVEKEDTGSGNSSKSKNRKKVVDNPAEVVDLAAPTARTALPLETVRAAFAETGKVGAGNDDAMPGWLLVHCPIGIISHREGEYQSLNSEFMCTRRVCVCMCVCVCVLVCVIVSLSNHTSFSLLLFLPV